MPTELEPVAASNSELISIPLEEVDDDELDPSKVARSDDDRLTELELMAEPRYRAVSQEENDGGTLRPATTHENIIGEASEPPAMLG
jgi:hypothetical protein